MEPSEGTTPNCRRFEIFRQSFRDTLSRATSTMSFEELQSYFPAFDLKAQLAIFDLYRQVLSQLKANSEAEFETIVADAHLLDKLDALEVLEEEHRLRVNNQNIQKVCPREAARGCRMKAKQAELQRLQAVLEKAETELTSAETANNTQRALFDQALATYRAIPETLSKVALATSQWASQA